MKPKYKRVLLKLSGEALAQGAEGKGIYNFDLLNRICTKVKECVDLGVQVAIVVGAGNIWRGKQGTDFQRVRADHMGMLATAINALALQDTLEHLGVDARVMSAFKQHQDLSVISKIGYFLRLHGLGYKRVQRIFKSIIKN